MEQNWTDKLSNFEREAVKRKISAEHITKLKIFYKLVDAGEIVVDNFGMTEINDLMIFEFWESHNYLWIGQRDSDLISWKEGYFHLGYTGQSIYNPKYMFENMKDLLDQANKEWFPK